MSAKMLRWERAWQRLTDAFYKKRVRGRCSSPKSNWKKRSQERSLLYDRLLRTVTGFGIKVRVNQEFGEVKDYYGQTWTPAGTWGGMHEGIKMSYDGSFYVLAHEFAHAVDYILSDHHKSHAQKELVASAAAYLFASENFGGGNLSHAVGYPTKNWGATAEDFKALEEYILTVFHQMDALFKMQA